MKRTTLTAITIASSLLALAPSAYAENTVTISNNGQNATSTVNVSTNTGNNTICINGKCSTSQGSTGKSTVCINGKCSTSDGGDVHLESEDGSAKVNIKSDSSSEVSLQQGSKSSVTNTVHVDQSVKGSSTASSIKDKNVSVKVNTDKRFDFSTFIKTKLELLRRIVTLQFLFGNK